MTSCIMIANQEQDQELLPGLIKNLRSVGINNRIVVAPCANKPPVTDIPFVTPLRWYTQNIVKDVVNALIATKADIVYKIDSDVLFLKKPIWFDQPNGMSGYANIRGKYYVYGACYSVLRKDLLTIQNSYSSPTLFEDIGVTRLMLKVGIKVNRYEGLTGWDSPTINETTETLHLGQHIKRVELFKLQTKLINYYETKTTKSR